MIVTGIVRRIDELGRIVIPRAIRHQLKINDNDPLEICISEMNNVVLRKYSPENSPKKELENAARVIETYAEGMYEAEKAAVKRGTGSLSKRAYWGSIKDHAHGIIYQLQRLQELDEISEG